MIISILFSFLPLKKLNTKEKILKLKRALYSIKKNKKKGL